MSGERTVSRETWLRLAQMAPPLTTADLASGLLGVTLVGKTLESIQAQHVADFADRLARLLLDRYPDGRP
jgi:hypothetical protein